MDVQLWRWSTAVQITSALLIALFFVVLTRSTHRTELRIWVVAWLANVLALVATLATGCPAGRRTRCCARCGIRSCSSR